MKHLRQKGAQTVDWLRCSVEVARKTSMNVSKLRQSLCFDRLCFTFALEELRLRGESGQYRVFCYRKARAGILVPRAFQKKTPETPRSEIALARRRLLEMLNEYEKDAGRT